jgi:sugar phosphate permease
MRLYVFLICLQSTRLARIPPWGIAAMRIHTWRNIFFFEGLFTTIIGLVAPFLMPRSPTDCWFLNERERMIATQRLVSKSGAEENEKTEVRHVKRAMLNITNYFCALGFFFINITVQGISLFMVRQASSSTSFNANQSSLPFSKISDGQPQSLNYTRYLLMFVPA